MERLLHSLGSAARNPLLMRSVARLSGSQLGAAGAAGGTGGGGSSGEAEQSEDALPGRGQSGGVLATGALVFLMRRIDESLIKLEALF